MEVIDHMRRVVLELQHDVQPFLVRVVSILLLLLDIYYEYALAAVALARSKLESNKIDDDDSERNTQQKQQQQQQQTQTQSYPNQEILSILKSAPEKSTIEDETTANNQSVIVCSHVESNFKGTKSSINPVSSSASSLDDTIQHSNSSLPDNVKIHQHPGDSLVDSDTDYFDLVTNGEDCENVDNVTLGTQTHSSVTELPSTTGLTSVFVDQSINNQSNDNESEKIVQPEQHLDELDGHIIKASNETLSNPRPKTIELNQLPGDEQLLDLLPPIDNNNCNLNIDAVDTVQDGLSELEVGGAQSFLQTNYPTEENFVGVVADSTPSLPSDDAELVKDTEENGMNNIATDGSACGSILESNYVSEPLSSLLHNNTVQTAAPTGMSMNTIDDKDDTRTKVGPVDDHLPTLSTSVESFHGGSTKDPLENVTEANTQEDKHDGDTSYGWDDTDYDVSLGGVSTSTELCNVPQAILEGDTNEANNIASADTLNKGSGLLDSNHMILNNHPKVDDSGTSIVSITTKSKNGSEIMSCRTLLDSVTSISTMLRTPIDQLPDPSDTFSHPNLQYRPSLPAWQLYAGCDMINPSRRDIGHVSGENLEVKDTLIALSGRKSIATKNELECDAKEPLLVHNESCQTPTETIESLFKITWDLATLAGAKLLMENDNNDLRPNDVSKLDCKDNELSLMQTISPKETLQISSNELNVKVAELREISNLLQKKFQDHAVMPQSITTSSSEPIDFNVPLHGDKQVVENVSPLNREIDPEETSTPVEKTERLDEESENKKKEENSRIDTIANLEHELAIGSEAFQDLERKSEEQCGYIKSIEGKLRSEVQRYKEQDCRYQELMSIEKQLSSDKYSILEQKLSITAVKHEEEYQSWQTQVEKLTFDLSNAEKCIMDNNAAHNIATLTLEANQARFEQIQKDCDILKLRYDEVLEERNINKAELDAFRIEAAQKLEIQSTGYAINIKEVESLLQTSMLKVTALNSEIEDLSRQNTELLAKTTQLEGLQNTINELQAENKSILQQNHNHMTGIEDLQSKMDVLETAKVALEEELSYKNQESKKLVHDLQQEGSEVLRLSKSIDESNAAFAAEVAKWNERLKEVECNLSMATAKTIELDVQLKEQVYLTAESAQKLEIQSTEYATKIKEVECLRETSMSKVAALHSEFEDLSLQNTELLAKTTQLEGLQNTINELQAENKSVQQLNHNHMTGIEDLQSKLDELETAKVALQEELSYKKEEGAKLVHDLQEEGSEVRRLSKSIDESNAAFAIAEAKWNERMKEAECNLTMATAKTIELEAKLNEQESLTAESATFLQEMTKKHTDLECLLTSTEDVVKVKGDLLQRKDEDMENLQKVRLEMQVQLENQSMESSTMQTSLTKLEDENTDLQQRLTEILNSLEEKNTALSEANRVVSEQLVHQEQTTVQLEESEKKIMEMESNLMERQVTIKELEKMVSNANEDLISMSNRSKSEILNVTEIFKLEIEALNSKHQRVLQECENLECETRQLHEEQQLQQRLNWSRKVMDEGLVVAGTGTTGSTSTNNMPRSITGVTIRTDVERFNARNDLLLTSNANKDAIRTLQETMMSYIKSL